MPIARKTTPPTSQIKEHLSVLTSLSAWTDTGEDEDDKPVKPKKEVDPGRCGLPDVEGDYFNMYIGAVIIANAGLIGVETEFGRSSFQIFEHCFNFVFFSEMILRVTQLKKAYFLDAWGAFDFVLVITGTLDLWVLPFVVGGDSEHKSIGTKLMILRLLRILRLMRVLRVLRLFRMFQQLNLIMQAFHKALQIVCLIGILVVIIDYVLAIMLTQGVGQQAERWGEESDRIRTMFGTIPASMSTLFRIMSLTDWADVGLLLCKVIPGPIVFMGFVGYIMVTSYTMVSLITGVITESLITSQNEYKHRKLRSHDKKRKALQRELSEFLNEIHEDVFDDTGTIPGEDIKTSIRGDTELLRKLAEIDVVITEGGILTLIDKMTRDGQDRINLNYFVEKLVNLTNAANASMVADLRYEIAKTDRMIQSTDKKLGDIISKAYPDAVAAPPPQPEVEKTQSFTNQVPQGKRSSLRGSQSPGLPPKNPSSVPKKLAFGGADD